MPSLFDKLHENTTNPLDNIEDILHANDWAFNRMTDNELTVQLSGKFCGYVLIFLWQPDLGGLQLSVQYDITIHPINIGEAAKILTTLNERTWMGHFEIPRETCTPGFRYTALISPDSKHAYAQLENIVDIAIAQCETNYTAFSLLTGEGAANDETLPLALMETQGRS